MKKLMILMLGLGLAFAASAANKPITATFNSVDYCLAQPELHVSGTPNIVLNGSKEKWSKCVRIGSAGVTVKVGDAPWTLSTAHVECYRRKVARQFLCSEYVATGIINCINVVSEISCP